VICGGRWTGSVAALAGGEIPMLSEGLGSPAVGLLALTSPAVHRIRRILFADDLMIRPDGAGRPLLHSDEHNRKVDPAGRPERANELAGEVIEAVSAHLDLASKPSLDRGTIGIRALTSDLLPAIGWLPHSDRVYAAVTHSGITLAPLLGELIAAEIVYGTNEPLLQPFRHARFATPVTAQTGIPPAASGAETPHGEVSR